MRILLPLCLISLALQTRVSAQQEILPGAIDGVFDVTDLGAATYTIPITVPDGIGGMQPAIAVTYNSQNRSNGILGVGWSLSATSAISRSANTILLDGRTKGPDMTANDRFAIDGSRLVRMGNLSSQTDFNFATEVESFQHIAATGTGGEPTTFTVTTASGVQNLYGSAANSRMMANGKPFSWYLSSSTDLNGNTVLYNYANTTGQETRLTVIRYGDLNAGSEQRNRILFHYESKADPNFSYVGGAKIESNFRLSRITVQSNGGNSAYVALYSYIFEYAPQKDQLVRVRHQSNVSTNGNISPTPVAEMPATDIFYENAVPQSITSTMVRTAEVYNEFAMGGDFNGDGKTDMIIYDNSHGSGNSEWKLYLNNGENDFVYVHGGELPQTPEHYKENRIFYDRINRSSFFDFDGDGREDLYTLKPVFTTHNNTIYEAGNVYKLYLSTLDASLPGGIRLAEDVNVIPDNMPGLLQSTLPLVGDFDGDGTSEILVLSNPNGYLPLDHSYLFGQKYSPVVGTGSNARREMKLLPNMPFNAEGINNNDQWNRATIMPFDYNGDGKTEILYVKQGVAKIYELNVTFDQNNNPTIHSPAFLEVAAGNYPTSMHQTILPGDFNGDGIADLLTFNATAQWSIAYGDGKGHFTDIRSLNSLQMAGPACSNVNRPRPVFIGDFNGDGISDILDFPGASPCFYDPSRIHYSKGNHEFETKIYNINSTQIGQATNRYVIGDFNGDGISDIVSRESSFLGKNFFSHKFTPFDHSKLLTKVVNGLGVATRVAYTKQTKDYFPLFNNAGHFSNVSYPLLSKPVAIPLVRSVFYDNGLSSNGENRMDYSFEKFTWGNLGRGMLGFQQVTVQDIAQQTTIINNFSTRNFIGATYSKLLLLPHSSSTVKAGIPVRSSRYRYDVRDLGGGRFWPFMKIKEEYDNVSRQNAREEHIYEEVVPGNIGIGTGTATGQGHEAQVAGGSMQPMSGTVVESTYNIGKPKKIIYTKGFYRHPFLLWDISGALETTTQSFSYPTMNPTLIPFPPIPYHRHFLPDGVLTVAQHKDQPTITDNVRFSYNNAKGWLTRKREHHGTPQLVITDNSYDTRGNLTGQTVSSSGNPTVTETIEYDPSHRYVRSRFNTAYPLLRSTNVYNGFTGWLRTATDNVNGLVTTYGHDAFGRPTSVAENTGLQKTTSISGATQDAPGNTRYTVSELNNVTNNYLRTHHDRLGRILRTSSVDFNGDILFEDVEYDDLGQITRKSLPYKQIGGTATYTTFSYDNLGRQTQVTALNGNTTFSYNAVANSGPDHNLSRYTLSTTAPDGTVRTAVTDAAGKQIEATDPGGTLVYTYHSSGQLLNTKLNGSIVTSSEYDAIGREIKKGDANFGFYQYTYDNYGNLRTQIDPRGEQYTYNYDVLGNLITKIGPEGTYTYSYNLTAAGFSLGKLTDIVAPAGISENYAYGSYGRMTQENKTIDGITFTNTFAYDVFGRPARKYFVSFFNGMAINFGYNPHNGSYERTFLNGGTAQDPRNLYAVLRTNVMGQTTLSGAFSTQFSGTNPYPDFDPYYKLNTFRSFSASGLLIDQISFPPVQYGNNFIYNHYNFDQNNGNLNSRADEPRGDNLENFSYDNLNRLTAANSVWGSPSPISNNIAYAPNGNITQKSDAGTFVYNSANKVSEISSYSNIPSETQTITYTPFDMVETMTEGNITAQFKYWPNGQRAKMEIKDNGITVRTKYYMDDFEREIKNGQTRDLVYVRGENDQYVAVIERVNNTNEKTYTVLADYLGSIERIIDNNSLAIVADKSFDAWGRERDAISWAYLPVKYGSNGWDRGYTGHEHIPEFGIINMNGRLYDPLLGRMVSPDPYIMGTENSQGYNRYTYALNNPLFYTDPSGEIVWAPVIIGAVVGAYLGGSMANNNLNAFKWDYSMGKTWGYMGIGALAGGLSGAGAGALGFTAKQTLSSVYAGSLNMLYNYKEEDGFGWRNLGSFAVGAVAGGISTGVSTAGGMAAGGTLNMFTEWAAGSFDDGHDGVYLAAQSFVKGALAGYAGKTAFKAMGAKGSGKYLLGTKYSDKFLSYALQASATDFAHTARASYAKKDLGHHFGTFFFGGLGGVIQEHTIKGNSWAGSKYAALGYAKKFGFSMAGYSMEWLGSSHVKNGHQGIYTKDWRKKLGIYGFKSLFNSYISKK